MPRIVLKPKYRGKKDASVVVSSNRKIVMKKKYKKPMNLSKLAYQIIKINGEKKEYGTFSSGLTVGQITVNSAGAYASSGHYLTSFITPIPTQGDTGTTRDGDEVIITGMYSMLQFSQQSNTTQGIKGKIYLFTPNVKSSSASISVGAFLNPNPMVYGANNSLVTVYDTMCSRNMDNFKNFNVLRTKSFYVPPDPGSTTQKLIKSVKCGIKFKKPWKVRFDQTGTLVEGQIYMLVVVESGNNSSNTPNLAAVAAIPNTDTLSGLNLNWFSKAYFIDP